MEARGSAANILNRKCVVLKWAELSSDSFLDLIQRGAGSLLILLPCDWSMEDNSTLKSWMDLEAQLLAMEIAIPIYFTYETQEILEIYEKLTSSGLSDKDGSAAAVLLTYVIGEGFTMIADSIEATVSSENHEIVTLTGKLSGSGYDQDLPTVAIVTHYDSFGLAPSLSNSGDSGGSGVAAALELARLFSMLYSNSQYKPKYNIFFVLTGGGKLNYFGTKYFIEDMLEDSDSFLLTDVDYAICLDALARGSELFLHVSKPPKEGTKAHELVNHLNQSSHIFNTKVTLNHKKIRIGDESLAWEHERFSLRRVPAATLSHFQDFADPGRKSMFHTRIDHKKLFQNVQLLAEAIGRHILGLSDIDNYSTPLFTGSMRVREKYLSAWVEKLSSIPRSPQLLTKDHSLLLSLEKTLSKYVDEVSSFAHKPDKSDPEFVMYTAHSTTMHAYSVKPAIFDLFLALGIAAYVGVIYLIVTYFHVFQELISPLVSKKRLKGE